MNLQKQVNQTASFLKNKLKQKPKVAIILGSGLGSFAETVESAQKIPYETIPNFKTPSVAGHAGQLVSGLIGKTPVIVQQGRWHFYEGHSMNEVVLPVRVYAELGVETVIITNAAGGVDKSFSVSDIMLITDQINLMGTNPLIGHSAKIFGTQFPDMSEIYDLSLRKLAKKIASKEKIKLQEGVYAALTGPNYETPAEIRMLRTLGANAVGMSTVPEAMASRHCKMKVLGFSCITNMAAGITKKHLHHDEIKEAANKAMNNFVQLLTGIVKNL